MSPKKRNTLEEIKAIRQRQTEPDFVFAATIRRLGKLRSLSATEFGNSEEFSRYIPKAVVASLQGFLRSVWGKTLDLGEPYSSRIAKYLKDKSKVTFDFITVRQIAREDITLGEFVAHSLSFNNFEDVTEAFSAILDCNFSDLLKQQSDSEGNDIIGDRAVFFQKIDVLFRERHIFSHELADHYYLSKEDALIFINVAEQLVKCVQNILSLEVRSEPIAQQEMNRYAREKAEQAQKILEERINLIIEILSSTHDDIAVEKYNKAHEAWLNYAQLEAAAYSDQFRGGTMAPFLSAGIYKYLTMQRIQTLEKYFDWLLDLQKSDSIN
ncbi:lysozyme inhibitor LprI family protein [Merismopedia glauca]|uniref:Lysozyme inhibitor LprI-like N-terminal domain-containing protein n=1 Tax=Merismopedia glauca CCAP 1448/3 TaxID=1296344 RepID=A0A2T1BY70_9CYAN|nr:lysozyme inhibitor LprI family protein [Merismopedia glauca]PSB00848.1 hypothetical protein C7B64_21350 [Merismopedia glauca CCAP 1448/3]